jgi:hypothetical protein
LLPVLLLVLLLLLRLWLLLPLAALQQSAP